MQKKKIFRWPSTFYQTIYARDHAAVPGPAAANAGNVCALDTLASLLLCCSIARTVKSNAGGPLSQPPQTFRRATYYYLSLCICGWYLLLIFVKGNLKPSTSSLTAEELAAWWTCKGLHSTVLCIKHDFSSFFLSPNFHYHFEVCIIWLIFFRKTLPESNGQVDRLARDIRKIQGNKLSKQVLNGIMAVQFALFCQIW